jgi:hypothetical protein
MNRTSSIPAIAAACLLTFAVAIPACQTNWRLGPDSPPAVAPAPTLDPVERAPAPQRPPAPPLPTPADPAPAPPASPPPASPPGPRAPQPAQLRLADCYVFIACASANNPQGRWVQPQYANGALADIVTKEALPLYEQGWRRFYVDSPFGKDTSKDGNARFTFFGSLRGTESSPWRRGFVPAWRKLTTKPGVRVIAYLGNPYFDEDFARLAENPANRARCLDLIRQAAQPLRDAGFHGIAIDASADSEEDSPLGDAMKEWHAAGLAVYTEATPKATRPWLKQFGTIRTTWFAANARNFPGLLSPNDCAGERIQLFDGNPPDPRDKNRPFEQWARRWINTCLIGGERPAFSWSASRDPRRALGLE